MDKRPNKSKTGKSVKFKPSANNVTAKKDKTMRKKRPQIDWTKITGAVHATDANIDWNSKKTGFREFCDMDAKESFQLLHRIDPRVTFVDINGVLSNKIDEDTNKERDYYENARDWWEPTNPIGQCKSIIGDHSPNLTCYICGLKMEEDGVDKNGKRFTPECEHILPVFHANMFLSLYNPNAKRTPEMDREMKMEYAWSHKCCNQVKSDTGFMHYNVSTNQLVMDFKSTKEILTKIYKGTRTDGETISNKIKKRYPNMDTWIRERADIINAENIVPICKYANEKLAKFPKLYQFSVLVNLISIADRDLMEMAQEKAGVGNKGPPVKESKSKFAIYEKWNHSLANQVAKITTKDINSPVVLESFVKHLFSNKPSPNERLLENGALSAVKLQTYIGHLCVSNKIDESSTNLSHFTFSSIFKDMFATTALMQPQILDPRIAGEKICKSAQSIALLSCILNKDVVKGEFDHMFQGISLSERQKLAILPQIKKTAEQFKNNVLIKALNDEIKKLAEDAGDKSDVVISILNALLKKSNIDLSDFISNIPTVDISQYVNNDVLLNARQLYMDKYGEPKNPDIDLFSEMELLEITAVDTLAKLMNDIQDPALPTNAIENIETQIESVKMEIQEDIERKQKEDDEYEKILLESALILETMKRKKPTPERLTAIVESIKKSPAKSPAIELQTQMIDAANVLLTLAKSDSPKSNSKQFDRIRESFKRSLSRSIPTFNRATKRVRMASPARRQ
jgi:hypothetical protein